jgi:hypothetical protein
MGLPPMGCNTLGKEDFILVPLPAAKTTTEKVIHFPLKERYLLPTGATSLNINAFYLFANVLSVAE